MALRKAGISLTLEGQAAYKAGLSEINREQRLLAQESKLAVAQLGTQASRQQTYTTQMDNYSKRIQVAADKTNTFKSRQKELPGIQNQISKTLQDTNAAYQDSVKETERLKNNYEQMRSALGKNNEMTQEAKKAYQDSKAETRELGDEVKKLEKAYDSNERELQNLPFALSKAEVATQQLRNEAQKLHEEYRNAGGRLADVSANFKSFGDTMIGVGDTLKNVGGFATKYITAPLALGSIAAIKAAIDYESAFAGVKKTVDEVYDANGNLVVSYDDLSRGIRDMAKELPATTTEIAAVAESAGQLGIQTENVLSFSKTMIDMGESTNLGSEEAATALARFANITGMSQDKFSNLGASIVDLGNNFATTESDIVNMAMRLAGAGAQVGLSEADILGLSAALSSVGIEAEMGGSAISKVMVNMAVATQTGLDAVRELEAATGMSRRELELMASLDSKGFKDIAGSLNMTTTEMNNIIKSGKNLEGFSAIAGMTGEQFKKAFEEDAVGALGAFIEGLGSAEEKGTSAIELLDEMGISEVRLRDSLLRAGNASELFADAIQQSNTAFDENVALTDEANKRYETTESKLKMLRNEVNDVAIEFGGPLVDALRDGLEASKPLIEGLGDLAEEFSNMDEATQQTIIKWGLFAMAGGPVLSMLGNIAGGFGTASKGVGELIRQYGKLTTPKTVGDVTTSFATIGTGAAGTATKIGGLISSIGGLPVVLGVAGAALLGWTAWKVWGEDAWNASQRTKEWGSDIGEVADEALNDFQNLSAEASYATDLMAINVETGADRAITAYANMAESIKEDVQETVDESTEIFAQLPPKIREIMEESMKSGIAEQTGIVTEIETINADITSIYEKALAENRELSESELTLVENYHQRLSELRRESLELSAEEQKRVQEVMAQDLEKFSISQLSERQQMLDKEKTALKESYDEQAEIIKEYAGTTAEYNEAMKILDQQHYNDMVQLGGEMMKVWEARGDIPKAVQEKTLADMGLTYQQVKDHLYWQDQAVENSNKNMIESSENASDKIREANDAWNNMEFFDKEGKLETNAVEKIQEASQSEEGWENLQFIAHNAELDTNSMQTIQEALMANGMWWEMEFPSQFAELETNAGKTATSFLQANYDWENMEYEDKMAILKTNSPETLKQVLIDTGVWENLSPPERQMIMTTNAGAAAKEGLVAEGIWNLLSPEEQEMVVTTNSTQKAIEGVKANYTWNGLSWIRKSADVETNAPGEVNKGVRSRNTWNGLRYDKKYASLSTNASDTENKLRHANNYFSGIRNKTRTFTLQYNTIGSPPAGAGIGHAKGTNFHPGGPMIVNDQKGPLYKELVSFPNGKSFVPEGRDVFIPNAPRGTKVLKAALTKNLIPKYETGVGFSEQSIRNFNSQAPVSISIEVNDPVVREEQDISKLSDAIIDKLTLNTKLKNLFNKGKGEAYAQV